MKLAMVGLGKMGGNMSRRLLKAGHSVIGYSLAYEETELLATNYGLSPSKTLEDAIKLLEPPRIVWIMVPAGKPTETIVLSLATLLQPGDVILDGGNSNYKDSITRAAFLKEKGIHFVDVGVSGGVWGLEEGYSLMIGGEPEIIRQLQPIFEGLAPAPDRGWGHVGPSGAGHYVKMIHNGIEYGMMEAYAEGFELMHARTDFKLDMHQISEIWRHGSVVRSWLLDLTARALEMNPSLEGIADYVEDSGEGRWTVMEAVENAVPAPVIALSLFRRFSSRQGESFAAKLLAAMRNQFGGHRIKEDL